MAEKKIMLYCSSLVKGGTERVVVNLAGYLAAHGMQVVLVTQYCHQDEYELPGGVNRIQSELTEEEKTSKRVGNFFARLRKLRGIIKEERPGCILSFIGKNNFMALLASFFTGIPVVVSVRGEPACEYASGAMRFLAKTLFVKASGIILQTNEAKAFFPRYLQKKAVILKNPLNPDFIREPFAGKRSGQIVSVGRVDGNKNHEMLIRAFAQVAEEFPETTLAVYGEGECRESLKELAAQLGLSQRISLPGAVSDVPDRIMQSSVFVLCSNSEGMPNALLEAMCLGIPCISTDCPCGGPAELISDGENGFLIPVGDTKALADRLRLLLADEKKAAGMGKRAAALLEDYKPETVNRQWQEYLLSRVGGSACVE